MNATLRFLVSKMSLLRLVSLGALVTSLIEKRVTAAIEKAIEQLPEEERMCRSGMQCNFRSFPRYRYHVEYRQGGTVVWLKDLALNPEMRERFRTVVERALNNLPVKLEIEEVPEEEYRGKRILCATANIGRAAYFEGAIYERFRWQIDDDSEEEEDPTFCFRERLGNDEWDLTMALTPADTRLDNIPEEETQQSQFRIFRLG